MDVVAGGGCAIGATVLVASSCSSSGECVTASAVVKAVGSDGKIYVKWNGTDDSTVAAPDVMDAAGQYCDRMCFIIPYLHIYVLIARSLPRHARAISSDLGHCEHSLWQVL